MDWAPWARIFLRYGIGFLAGSEAGEALSMNPDLVLVASFAMGAAVEAIYAFAKRKGWRT